MLLVQQPKVLLVDEPVAGMTHAGDGAHRGAARGLAGAHTVVVVEHDMDFVRSIARQVTVLHEGRVLAEGPMDEIQNDPRVIEVYLGDCDRLRRDAAAAKVHQFYGSSHTLRDIDLDRPRGGLRRLMGRNGVGKTTLLKAIMGLVPASPGSIKFGEHQLAGDAAAKRARGPASATCRRGARSSPQLTVEENLRIGRVRRGDGAARSRSSCCTLFPVLKKMMHRRGGDLSGGQQQQLAIARALTIGPKRLLLDEPTEGIQPNIVHEIGDVILELVDEGMTVLLVEQKLAFARRVGRSFSILDRGPVVAGGEMGDLTDDLVRRHLTV